MTKRISQAEYSAMVGEVFEENITGIMRVLNSVRKRAAVHTDAEIESRINGFFESCYQAAVLPDLASLALSLGISKNTLEGWARGINCSAERHEMIQRAYTTIEAAQIQATARGNFNPLLFMFLAKSKYGYREDGSIGGHGDRMLIESGQSAGQIADRYNTPLPVNININVPSAASVSEPEPVPVEKIPAEDGEVVLPETEELPEDQTEDQTED